MRRATTYIDYSFTFIGMQVNDSSNCSCWDGSETNIPSTMLLGQQTPQEMLNPFTGEYNIKLLRIFASSVMVKQRQYR